MESTVKQEDGGMERSGVESQGSVDIYVRVVRQDEEDVVGINANANVVRNAEAYEEWQVRVGEEGYRRNDFKQRIIEICISLK